MPAIPYLTNSIVSSPPVRLAVIADVHANLPALDAVLADIDARTVDAVLCLGDIVGYGPAPGAALDRVREVCAVSVMGNHDEAVATGNGIDVLPTDGQAAARAHREALSEDHLEWLGGLPLTAEAYGVTLAHAGPFEPASWPRLDSFSAVQAQFAAFDTDVCFVGHSHRPAIVSDQLGVMRVRRGPRYLINVGSVGQPRDRDPRAAYGLFDTEAWTFEQRRVHYDVSRTQSSIRAAGLPARLADRLAEGR